MSLKHQHLYEFEDFRFDIHEKTLWFGEERVSLAPRVLETLSVLIENSGRLMTKDELMDEIWGDTFVEERNLTQNIFTLRKEFKKRKKGAKFIETVPRRGYRFIAELHPVEIEREETLALKHSKQMHITAEGTVSKKQLAEAVKDFTKDLTAGVPANEIEPESLEAKKENLFRNSKPVLALGILIIITCGGGLLIWNSERFQNYFSFNKGRISAAPVNYEILTESGNALDSEVSPDNQYIAYVNNEKGKYSVVLRHIETDSETVVVAPKPFEIVSPQFSADGNYLFYGARDGKMETTIYRVPIFGGTPREIMTNVNNRFSISPDGNLLAYFRHDPKIVGNHLIVCRTDGNDERIVATKDGIYYYQVWNTRPGWSPDSKKLIAVVIGMQKNENGEINRPYLVEVDTETGAEKQINTPDWYDIKAALWMKNDDDLIVLAQDAPASHYKIYRLSYPEGTARLLTNDTNNYTYLTLAGNNDFIITTERKTPYNLHLISTADPSQVRRLTDSTMVKHGSMDWTPDGKFLIYSKSEGNSSANIWKINVETLEETQLTFQKDSLNGGDISVTPDGSKIYFISNRTGTRHVWRMNADGSNQEQFLNGAGETSPEVSPDGKWLTYVTSALKPNILWKKPLQNDGEPVKLLKEGASGAHSVSPDMTKVVAGIYDKNETEEDPWRYIIIPFDNDGEVKYEQYILAADSLDWSPDSKGLYFLDRSDTHSDIYYYSLADQSITKITNFSSLEIALISVSPDGSTIAAARGKRSSNLFKITNF